jgi:betaine reductase
MDPESQQRIKEIADRCGNDDLVVVLGASDIESAEIAAETVIKGDPAFVGPLAGVSLRLPVYHILESAVKEAIPSDIYEQEVGLVSMISDVGAIESKFKKIRGI